MRTKVLALGALAALLLGAGCGDDDAGGGSAGASADGGQKPVKLTIGAFAGPGQTAALAETATKMGIAKKHGIDLEVKYAGTIGAFYTNLANGTVDGLAAGTLPTAAQRLEGVPIKIVNTLTTLKMTSVLTKDPKINSLADLKGKRLAATTASSEYQVLSVAAEAEGVELGKDIKIVNAESGAMQALLEAGRVEAVDAWEPTVTQMQKKDPKVRIIWNGLDGWKEFTGRTGRNLNFVVREDFLKKNPDAVDRITAMWAETVETIESKPDEVDQLLVKSAKIPKGLFSDAQKSGRLGWKVEPASEAEPTKDLETLMEKAVEGGILDRAPDDFIYRPDGAANGS